MQCSLSTRHQCGVRVASRRGARTVAAVSTWNAAPSEAPAAANTRAFARLSIYKGKAAMQLSVIPPTWSAVPGDKGMSVSREGAILLEFASVSQGTGGQSGYGERAYNWDEKIVFALKGVEAANLLDQKKINDPSAGISLIHDPNINTAEKGQTTKTLGVKQNADGSTWAFTISQTSGGAKSNVFVPVTAAEMIAIQNVVSYAIPRLLGIDVVLTQPIFLS